MASQTQYSASGSGAIRVLLVDDDSVLVRSLQRVLGVQGFDVDTALDGRVALNRLENNDYDVMLLDLRLGGTDGMELYAVAQNLSAPATIIHSAHVDVRTAVLATRAGVQDVMQKPVPEDVLALRIRELAGQRRASAGLRSSRRSGEGLGRLVGSSDKTEELREHVRRVSQFSDVSVLIQGPTGTGKELVAQAVHELSCPGEPFVSINCAAVPEQLFESELFGHEAGAFTSARAQRVGLFEEAARGTLFLDEIGELPLMLQAKLLRVLEIRQFRRVGGTRTRMFSARVVSATNRTLSSASGAALRPDLFFRLAGYAIHTPALVERLSDVPALAQHFLAQFASRHQMSNTRLSSGAVSALLHHGWPGNIRELRAVLENASIVAQGPLIERADVELALRARSSSFADESCSQLVAARDSREQSAAEVSTAAVEPTAASDAGTRRPASLPNIQRDLILRAFEDSQHNLSKAALDLGIPRSTLRARLKRYGVR